VPDNAPFALVQAGTHGLRITAVNARAAHDGIHPGLSLADTRAALPSLLSRPAEPEQDARALLKLARWLGRYGPARHCDGRDSIWINITGVAHLFGGEQALLEDLTSRLQRFRITARAGLADTLGAAHALARFATARSPFAIAAPDAAREALAALPSEALRLDAETVLLLKRLGLGRIGQLYHIPRDALERRFRSQNSAKSKARSMADAAAAVLTRLDQATGRAPEPRRALGEPPALSQRRSWGEPLMSSETLMNETLLLCEDLAKALQTAGLGTRRIRLSLYRADGTVAGIEAGLSRASHDAAHLMRLLHEKLSAINAGFGIDVAALDALVIERVRAEQNDFSNSQDFSGSSSSATAVSSLIDRLANRLGDALIYCLEPHASHIPERAERRVRSLAPAKEQGPAWPRAKQRPPLLLSPPEPIIVMAEVPEGAPLRFTFRRVKHRVIKAQGPERIAPEWWRHLRDAASDDSAPPARPRDYYTLETETGARFWVYRDGLYTNTDEMGEPTWFMHGLFG
jgi:protein ImuB